jgi:hypothetical protein
VGNFFKDLEEETVKLLCTSPILESVSRVLRPPSYLIFIPESFNDKEGKPLVLTERTASRYLSHKYPPSEQGRLSHLGVSTLTIEGFIGDLRGLISRCPDKFHVLPDEWHSRLAEALMSSTIRSQYWKAIVSTLRIVPLRDNRWVSPNDGNLLFPSRSKDLMVPRGIDIFEIHSSAESDYFRRPIFMSLGAKEFQSRETLSRTPVTALRHSKNRRL